MNSILNYWNKKFIGKEVIVNLSDIRQQKGILERVLTDGIFLKQEKKEFPIVIPKNSILSLEVFEG